MAYFVKQRNHEVGWTRYKTTELISIGQLCRSCRSGLKIKMQLFKVILHMPKMLLEGLFVLSVDTYPSCIVWSSDMTSKSWNKYNPHIQPVALWSCLWHFYKHAWFQFSVSIRSVTSDVIYIFSQEHFKSTSTAVALCWLIFTCMVLSVTTWNTEGTKTLQFL